MQERPRELARPDFPTTVFNIAVIDSSETRVVFRSCREFPILFLESRLAQGGIAPVPRLTSAFHSGRVLPDVSPHRTTPLEHLHLSVECTTALPVKDRGLRKSRKRTDRRK